MKIILLFLIMALPAFADEGLDDTDNSELISVPNETVVVTATVRPPVNEGVGE